MPPTIQPVRARSAARPRAAQCPTSRCRAAARSTGAGPPTSGDPAHRPPRRTGPSGRCSRWPGSAPGRAHGGIHRWRERVEEPAGSRTRSNFVSNATWPRGLTERERHQPGAGPRAASRGAAARPRASPPRASLGSPPGEQGCAGRGRSVCARQTQQPASGAQPARRRRRGARASRRPRRSGAGRRAPR